MGIKNVECGINESLCKESPRVFLKKRSRPYDLIRDLQRIGDHWVQGEAVLRNRRQIFEIEFVHMV